MLPLRKNPIAANATVNLWFGPRARQGTRESMNTHVRGAVGSADVKGTVDKATNSTAFEYAARAGFAVSGLLHLLLAYLVLRIAFGGGGNADQSGALATIASTPGGTIVLWAATVGLAALGLWRVAEFITGSKSHDPSDGGDDDTKDMVVQRVKSASLAVVYFGLAFSAAKFAMGSGQNTAQQNSGMSAQMMQSGFGRVVLIVVGLVVIGVGGYHVYKGATKRFYKDLTISEGASQSTYVTPIGMAGYLAKGLVLGGAGVLVIVATLQFDPAKASGIDAALKTLGQAPFGKFLLVIAALGFAAYGLYNFVHSKFGRM